MMRTLGTLAVVSLWTLALAGCGEDIVDDSHQPAATAQQTPYANVTLLTGVSGNGRITSTPALVNCSSSQGCSYSVAQGSHLTLVANALGGVNFRSWSDAYCGNNATCSITMNGNALITAAFGCVSGASDNCGCAGEPCCDGSCGSGLYCDYDWSGQMTCQ